MAKRPPRNLFHDHVEQNARVDNTSATGWLIYKLVHEGMLN